YLIFGGRLLMGGDMDNIFMGHWGEGSYRAVTYSADGKLALSGGEWWGMELWNTQTRQAIRAFEGKPKCDVLALSPDNRRALSAHSSDPFIRVWDVETGKEIRRLEGHSDVITCLAFSPNGKWALSGS